MSQIVALPNGEEAEFPDTMSDAEIEAVLQKQFPKPAPAEENLSPTQLLARSREAGAKNVPGWAMPATLGLITAPEAVLGAIAHPGATAASFGGGWAGGTLGEKGGRFLESLGAPAGTSKALGVVGGLAGGGYGFAKGQALLQSLFRSGIKPGGMLGALLERAAGAEAAPALSAEALAAKEAAASKSALEKAARAERSLALRERAVADREARTALLRQRLEGKAPLATRTPKATPKPETAPPPSREATAVEPETAPVLPAGQRAPATNLGGKAKPAPRATPPEELEETLRKSIEAAKARKAAAAAESPLRGPRLEVGAEKVGRGVGLTKEEVRLQTGPRLDETLGEASPILPDTPFEKIIDTMKALPKTGGYREAYVARATSGKTRWQVENIRRQLVHLGLLVPVGTGAAVTLRRSE